MADRPNFLLIVADDLGFSDIGAFGSEIDTPCLDELAATGVRLTDFHAASACSPTRSMIMSGTDHHIAGIGTMAERIAPQHKDQPGYEGYLNDQVVALPELLRDAGYETLMSGKWHLGTDSNHTPHARGFDRSFSLLVGCHNHYGWEPEYTNLPGTPRLLTVPRNLYQEDGHPFDVNDLPKDFYSSDFFTDKLLEYFKARQDRKETKPFFAYVPYSAPHWPLQAPKENRDKYMGRYDEGPEALRQARLRRLKDLGLVPEDAVPAPVISKGEDGEDTTFFADMSASEKRYSSRTMEVYAGLVDRMDYNIGRVVDHLKEVGELDNTLIIFLSDNGAEGALWEAQPLAAGGDLMGYINKYHDNSIENLGAYNSFVWYGAQWASAATAPGRLFKMYTSEGGTRVPCIIRYPRLIKANSIDHSFGTVMDILPTLLELAEAHHPAPIYHGRPVAAVRGRSWIPYFRGSTLHVHSVDQYTGWELFGRMALRVGDYKILMIPKPHGPGKWELFNLKVDPGEVMDLAEGEPERMRQMLELFQQYVLENNVILTQGDIWAAAQRGKSNKASKDAA